MKNIYILLNIFLLSSCNKNDLNLQQKGSSYITLNALYLDSDELYPIKNASNKSMSTNETIEKVAFDLPFDDVGTVEVSLERESSEILQNQNTSLANKARVSSLKSAIRTAVPTGIKYRLVAYDASGNLDKQAVYTTGSENLTPDFNLNAGETYTFVFISYNNTITPPEILAGHLSSAILSTISSNQDLMYYKTSKQLVDGDNKIDIIFKHKFSKVTTTIDASELGNIQNSAASPVSIGLSPNSNTVNLDVNSGAVTYGTTSSLNVNFSYSSPTLVLSNSIVYLANNGTQSTIFSINSITINGTTKNFSSIDLGNLIPGSKYILNIKIKNDRVIDNDLVFAPGNLVYTAATNTYSFEEYQYLPGSLFPADKLKPVSIGVDVTSFPDGDPCSMVANENGKSWRTPTELDINPLVANIPALSILSTMNGINGRLILGKVFLPIVPYFNGVNQNYEIMNAAINDPTTRYLAHYSSYPTLYARWFFLVGTKNNIFPITTSTVYSIYGGEALDYGFPIRCVRDR